ncbi:AsnC family protein [Humidisolicoccus flavus]|uniref:AsnC family protein n=1 Tax=Humidisolicoccus flavus TaxID=3111414 RepID=UPI00324D022A
MRTINAGDDSAPTLRELRECAAQRTALEQSEAALVRRARVEGYAWAAIASALGITRQAAHKKYGKR